MKGLLRRLISSWKKMTVIWENSPMAVDRDKHIAFALEFFEKGMLAEEAGTITDTSIVKPLAYVSRNPHSLTILLTSACRKRLLDSPHPRQSIFELGDIRPGVDLGQYFDRREVIFWNKHACTITPYPVSYSMINLATFVYPKRRSVSPCPCRSMCPKYVPYAVFSRRPLDLSWHIFHFFHHLEGAAELIML
jgi:hypothetical protein